MTLPVTPELLGTYGRCTSHCLHILKTWPDRDATYLSLLFWLSPCCYSSGLPRIMLCCFPAFPTQFLTSDRALLFFFQVNFFKFRNTHVLSGFFVIMQVIYILWRLENNIFFFEYLYFPLPDTLATKRDIKLSKYFSYA